MSLLEPRLPEALVASRSSSGAEERTVLRAVAAFDRRKTPDDFHELRNFLAAHPQSPWRIAILTNLGIDYLHYGYFSRALAAWEEAWREGKAIGGGNRVRALVDLAAGKLALLQAQLGHEKALAALLAEMHDRPVTGPAGGMVLVASNTLFLMRHDPDHLYLCGPLALRRLLLQEGASPQAVNPLRWMRVGAKGASLAELAHLAEKSKVSLVPVFRKPGEGVPVPSIVHWKVGHFATILSRGNGRYRIEDPTVGRQALWVTKKALDEEASGYFLAPAARIAAAGWRTVPAKEAGTVWGAGSTSSTEANSSGPLADWGSCGPMCGYNIGELDAGLFLQDHPVGYSPQLGPSAKVSISYNEYLTEPGTSGHFNVSAGWTLNWLRYVRDDPQNIGQNVLRLYPTGGGYYETNYKSSTGYFAPEEEDASQLALVSTSPVVYKRYLADGSVEVYQNSDGSTSYPRRVFLTQLIDPQGNALTFSYDSQMRLTAITDATGRQTTFSYNSGYSMLLVTQITDPFGRSATLHYSNSSGQVELSSITDVLGITSSFSYGSTNSSNPITVVTQLTTPYGTTSFNSGTITTTGLSCQGTNGTGQYLDITDPLGYHEREEGGPTGPWPVGCTDPVGAPSSSLMYTTNNFLQWRDSFHWDKHQYELAGCTVSGGCNYSDARVTHFHHQYAGSTVEWHSIESVKNPLENRVWYDYPNQPDDPDASIDGGTYNSSKNTFYPIFDAPTMVGRVLSHGLTQLWQFCYNNYPNNSYYQNLGSCGANGVPAFGNGLPFAKIAQIIDPSGRQTNFSYASNGIDLLTVTQQTASGAQTIASFGNYNSQHRPQTYTDAAGQVWHYGYNAQGQLTSITDPLSETTSYQYDSLGRLSAIINADNKTQASFTYDSYDRVATFTDSEGWSASYQYDAADRLSQITYPDGTTRKYTYNILDLASYTDRQGNTWTYTHDADRRLTAVADPLGNTVQYGYNKVGYLTSITDPRGDTTSWTLDGEDRPISKTYADGSKTNYDYYPDVNLLYSVTDALNQTTYYGYYLDNRLGTIVSNLVPLAAFYYDPYFPRVTQMSDPTGTTSYTYVPVGTLGALQLYQDAGPLANSTVAYGYDQLGRVSSRQIGGLAPESFQYDAIGRLKTHTDALGQFSMTYLGETGQITSRQLVGGSVFTNWSYLTNTNDRRLASINDSQQRQFIYTTTPEALIGEIKEEDGSGNLLDDWTYSYDNAYRLTGAASALGNFAYTLDPAGNITSYSGTGASYNNLNESTALGTQAYSWDADGELLADGLRNYGWDVENRLASLTYPGSPGVQSAFTYDGLDRRFSAAVTSGGTTTTTYFLWCGAQICESLNADGSINREFYPEGEIVAATGTSLYYGPDQLGTPRVATDQNSNQYFYEYDPLGKPLSFPTGGAPLVAFRWAGQYYDTTSLLDLTHYRAYDPGTGRWVTRDPLGELSGGEDITGSGSVGEGPVGPPGETDSTARLLATIAQGVVALPTASIPSLVNPFQLSDPAANLYRYGNGDPVSLSDPLGLWVAQLGFTFSYAYGVGGIFGIGVAFDGHGNVVPYAYYGGGAGFGAGASISAEASAAIGADSVADLSGFFGNASVSGGAGLVGGFEGYAGYTAGGREFEGLGGSIGFGGGFESFVGATYTVISSPTGCQ